MFNLHNKKIVFIAGLAVTLLVTFVSGAILYKNRNHPSPFEKRVFQALSFTNLPFMEGQPFFFPAITETDKKNQTGENKAEVILEEASSMKKSKSDDWWLNSGGVMISDGKEFSPNIGALGENSSWRKLYSKNNARDTDGGYFPQNIFRLVTRKKWENFSQSVYFNIDKINLSKSEYRNESNGILLFNRYQDGDNLYYTGLRVDGYAVIKKKIKGKYYTLAGKNLFAKEKKYDREDVPNLLPVNVWMGLKSEVKNIGDKTVKIKVYIDKMQNGNWQLVLEKEDTGDKYGKVPLSKAGYAGIRTDFMDVEFRNYSIQGL